MFLTAEPLLPLAGGESQAYYTSELAKVTISHESDKSFNGAVQPLLLLRSKLLTPASRLVHPGRDGAECRRCGARGLHRHWCSRLRQAGRDQVSGARRLVGAGKRPVGIP